MAELFEEIKKFNPYHGSDGRFATSGSAASFTYKPGQGKMYDNAIQREKERAKQAVSKPADPHSFDKEVVRSEVSRLKFASQSEKEQFLRDHYAEESDIREYASHGATDSLLEFIATCAERSSIPKDRESRKEQLDLVEEPGDRTAKIADDTGMSYDESERVMKAFDSWFEDSDYVSKSDAKKIEKYVERAPVYDGKIFRGLNFSDREKFDAFISEAGNGKTFGMSKGLSSWSSEEKVAKDFAGSGGDFGVIIECLQNRTGTPIAHLSQYFNEEQEVIASGHAKWIVLGKEMEYDDGKDGASMRVYVTEWSDDAA